MASDHAWPGDRRAHRVDDSGDGRTPNDRRPMSFSGRRRRVSKGRQMSTAALIGLGVVFLADLGDKSQLLTLTYGLR